MTTELLSYHGDAALKVQVLDQLRAHREADEIVKGVYWEEGKGCAVGCLTHDPGGGHEQYPSQWGLPSWLARWEDAIFEGLSIEKAREWPERFMSAIPVGVEVPDSLHDRLAVERLRAECLPLAPIWPETVRAQVVEAIEGVIAAIEVGSAQSAAESAALAAARSAAQSAQSAQSARSAALAAWSALAAESAWEREADRLVEALAALGS